MAYLYGKPRWLKVHNGHSEGRTVANIAIWWALDIRLHTCTVSRTSTLYSMNTVKPSCHAHDSGQEEQQDGLQPAVQGHHLTKTPSTKALWLYGKIEENPSENPI